jgi:type I restriction enzyme, R subunit
MFQVLQTISLTIALQSALRSANQIEFVNLIIGDLTQNSVVEPSRFYESPFTDLSPQGPESLFTEPEIDRLVQVLADVRHNADVA